MRAFNRVKSLCNENDNPNFGFETIVIGENRNEKYVAVDVEGGAQELIAVNPILKFVSTGFVDRMGKEIFEGDYIDIDDNDGFGHHSELVYYDENRGAFRSFQSSDEMTETFTGGEYNEERTVSYINTTISRDLTKERAARAFVIRSVLNEFQIAARLDRDDTDAPSETPSETSTDNPSKDTAEPSDPSDADIDAEEIDADIDFDPQNNADIERLVEEYDEIAVAAEGLPISDIDKHFIKVFNLDIDKINRILTPSVFK